MTKGKMLKPLDDDDQVTFTIRFSFVYSGGPFHFAITISLFLYIIGVDSIYCTLP